ncbi:unnamed protein product [Sphacelaria rigidula]
MGGCVLAWEQGMVTAERAAAYVGADHNFLRFDHPTMANELAEMEALEGEQRKSRVPTRV